MKISIIIPAKNEEKNITLCFNSLIRHKSDKIEIIVVDNGSTDNTVNIAELYADKVFVKPDLNISGLRNYGAKKASSEVIAFLDADCIVDENWIGRIKYVFNNSKVGCTGSTPIAPENGTWVEKIWSSFRTRRKSEFETSWINSSNLIIRKEFFDKVNGFNTDLNTCEDVDICFRLKNICKIIFDPSIKVTHLGEPKTVFQFFVKEIWRGSGVISGIISHGLILSEIKSILLPSYYFILSAIIFITILLFNFNILFSLIILYILPGIIFSIWAVISTKKIKYTFGYLFLFFVYANARAIALLTR